MHLPQLTVKYLLNKKVNIMIFKQNSRKHVQQIRDNVLNAPGMLADATQSFRLSLWFQKKNSTQ